MVSPSFRNAVVTAKPGRCRNIVLSYSFPHLEGSHWLRHMTQFIMTVVFYLCVTRKWWLLYEKWHSLWEKYVFVWSTLILQNLNVVLFSWILRRHHFSWSFPWLPFRNYVEGGMEVVVIFQKSLNRYTNIVNNGRALWMDWERGF